MRRLSQWLPSLGLLLLAAALGLVAGGGGGGADNPTPSVKNPGPLGLEVLATWLRETGADVRALDGPLTALPAGLKVLVIAAPREQRLSGEELAAVKAFVERGGTLVWLATPEAVNSQRRLAEWLRAERGEPLGGLVPEDRSDLGARTVRVDRQVGLARGLAALRVSSGFGLRFDDDAMVPIAGAALWAKPVGDGEVWVAAGADLAQARRLEHEGNLLFWANAAARGPLGFDEHHHTPESGPPLTANIPASLFQLGALGLFFVLAFGRRLGPPRPEPVEVHRSSLEYIAALAALTQRAKVEPALLRELHQRLRRQFHDRLGISPTLPDAEAAREVGLQLAHAPQPIAALLLALARPGSAGPREFTRLSRDAALLEQRLRTL